LKRISVSKFGREPRWRLAHGLRVRGLPEATAVWLFDSESLTRRLKQASRGDFRVRLLRQHFERPLFCERRALGLDDRALALVRQVHLYCGGEIKVYARSIIPLEVLRGRSRRLGRLGGRPLGEMLFRDKSMRRSPMEIARIEPGDLFHGWGVPAEMAGRGAVWGRRSVFRLGGQALLVNEIFLPPLPGAGGFRIKHKV
jgi:chorismate--pyruvate lyase